MIGTFILFIVCCGAAATYLMLTYAGSSTPRRGVVVSYGTPVGLFGGGSCGGVAVVRMSDGQVVSAASFLHTYLQKGAFVTVVESRSSCPPTSYTVLHVDPTQGASLRAN